MNKKVFIFFIFFILVSIAFLFLDNLIFVLDNVLNSSLIDKSYLMKVFTFIFIYAISISFLLPLGLILMPLSGYLFGVLPGFFICNFSIAIGLILVLFIVKKNFSDFIDKKIKKYLPKIKNLISENNLTSLFLIRLIGVLPFSIQNILSAHITSKSGPYILIPLFVMSPWTVILNYLGSKLQEYSLSDNVVILDFFKNDYLSIFVLIFYLVIFFFVIKNLKKKLNKTSSHIKICNK